MHVRFRPSSSDAIEQQIRQLPCSRATREQALAHYRIATVVVGWVADRVRRIHTGLDAAVSHALNASRLFPARKL